MSGGAEPLAAAAPVAQVPPGQAGPAGDAGTSPRFVASSLAPGGEGARDGPVAPSWPVVFFAAGLAAGVGGSVLHRWASRRPRSA